MAKRKHFWKLYSLLVLFVVGLIIPGVAYSQEEKLYQGIVTDQNTGQRVAKVFIYNANTDQGVYNNAKGEFNIFAKSGDVLIAAVEGYYPDTLHAKQQELLLFNLFRKSIMIQEVQVFALKDPNELLKKTKEEYSTAYTKVGRNDLLSVGQTGAGLNIDALYGLISREGKNARRLQAIIERDYRESVIDYRFTTSLVSHTTGLTGEKLRDFMQQYRPSYFFIMGSNEYHLVDYIRSSYAQYLRNPTIRRLPSLPQMNGPLELFQQKDSLTKNFKENY